MASCAASQHEASPLWHPHTLRWGVLVTISDSTKFQTADTSVSWVGRPRRQNDHTDELGLPAAKKYLDNYTTEWDRLALRDIGKALNDLNERGYSITSAGLVLASGRALRDLAHI